MVSSTGKDLERSRWKSGKQYMYRKNKKARGLEKKNQSRTITMIAVKRNIKKTTQGKKTRIYREVPP